MPLRFSFLRFGRKSRPDPGRTDQSQDHIRFQLPPKRDVRPDPLDPQAVLRQWHRLRSLDRNSPEYNELLGTLVGVESNRKVAMKFTDENAEMVINIIGEALKSERLRGKIAHQGFVLLRKLSARTGRLPDCYLVQNGPNFQVEAAIFAAGGFADVRRGTLTGKRVAIKTIRRAQDQDLPNIQKDFCKECVLWMHISHRNVLELLAVNIDPETGALSMIAELMENGNIMQYIRTNEANRLCLLDDVASGLSYLHKCGIIHGDLKGTNVLVKNGANPQACLSDFGFAAITPTASFAVSVTGDECTDTVSYMAPELLHPSEFGLKTCQVSKQADIYAFGIVVYGVLTGHPPFRGRLYREIILLVLEGERPRKPENARDIGFGRGTWELVQQCWNQERDERPTVEQVSEHFRSVAGNSSIVPPEPTTPAFYEVQIWADSGLSLPLDISRLSLLSQRGTSILQQTRLIVDPTNSGGVRPSVSVPCAQLTPVKPSLFKRVGACIMGWKPAFCIGVPESPSPQT